MRVWKIKNEKYKNNANFGLLDIQSLCDLIGMKLEKDYSYGFSCADYKGHRVSITRDRSINRITFYIENSWSNKFDCRELTQKKLDNIIVKMDKIIKEMEDRKVKIDNKNLLGEQLAKLGIVCFASSLQIQGYNFYPSMTPQDRVSGNHYISSSLSDTAEEFEQLIQEYRTKWMEEKRKCEIAREIGLKHINLIKEYYGQAND